MNKKNSDFIDELNKELGPDEDSGVDSEKKPGSDEFSKLLNESLRHATRKLSVGDRIRGQILVLGQDDVFVSTGTQHDGLMSKRELLDEQGNCPFKTGDMIDVYVTLVRGSDVRVSRNPTNKNVAEDLEDAFDMMLPVQGRIVETCNGGVRVNLKGKLAFCPISQLDSKRVENAEDYVGKSFEFRITQFSENGKNIVVSRRLLLQEERELGLGSFLEEHPDGDIVDGKVVRLEKFGAFVELAPGVDGLVHISEMAWSRVGDPSEVVQVGDTVKVKILKRETVNDRVKISLSIKQTMDQASARPVSKFSVGQVIEGKVSRKEIYGVFVQLEPGISGLLHKSKAIENPNFQYEKIKIGDTLTVQISEIRGAEGKISLDLPRDPNEEDWKKHTQTQTSFGTLGGALGDQLKAAFSKKKQN